MAEQYFHIGHHKTATTWLQKGLWFDHSDINYANREFSPPRCKLLQSIIGVSDRYFNSNTSAEILNTMNSLVHPNEMDVIVNLVSAERLSGHPLSGGYDSYSIANRLKLISPKAKIIIGVRHQFSMLGSMYIQMLKEGFVGSFDTFVNSKSWKRPFFRQDYLEYHFLVAHYQKLFGKNNVLVMLYEDLVDSPKMYIEKICKFMGLAYIQPNNLELQQNSSDKENTEFLIRRNLKRKSEYNLHPLPSDTSESFLNSLVDNIGPFKLDLATFKSSGLDLSAFRQSNKLLFSDLGKENSYAQLDARFCN